MKRFWSVLLAMSLLTCGLCGCSEAANSDSMQDCVELCDYTNLTVAKEECFVTEDEINTYIQLSLGALDVEVSEITDDIAVEYLNAESVEAAKANIKKEIIQNRYFEAARDMIFETSGIVRFPRSCDDYVDELVAKQKQCAEREGVTADEYFQKAFEMSEAEYREAALWGYADLMILKAIAEKEQYVIDSTSYTKAVEYTADLDGITYEEAVETYGEEYFEYILYEDFLKQLITEVYCEEIVEIVAMC